MRSSHQQPMQPPASLRQLVQGTSNKQAIGAQPSTAKTSPSVWRKHSQRSQAKSIRNIRVIPLTKQDSPAPSRCRHPGVASTQTTTSHPVDRRPQALSQPLAVEAGGATYRGRIKSQRNSSLSLKKNIQCTGPLAFVTTVPSGPMPQPQVSSLQAQGLWGLWVVVRMPLVRPVVACTGRHGAVAARVVQVPTAGRAVVLWVLQMVFDWGISDSAPAARAPLAGGMVPYTRA
jgi:hypothetical protein